MAKKTKALVDEAMGLEEYKPHIELTESIYPKVKDLKVDETITLELRVKISSINRREYGDKKLCASAVILDAEEESEED